MLHPRLTEELERVYQRLRSEGKLLSREQLAHYYAVFRDRFGPEQLLRLDGEALLTTMHDHSTRDSLVYWLEFKDDEEFPAAFGSIAGGSALKFGLYRRKETGAWMTGNPAHQRELSVDEAVEIARQHRAQLVRGAQILSELPMQAGDVAYRELQALLDAECPDVSDKAWGHKYFSLLYPDKLDDYHVEDHQRFHLIKLLQIPPEGKGRYLCAGRYVAIAERLEWPLNHLTTCLNRRNGQPYDYWRIGTRQEEHEGNWRLMLETGTVAIGWPRLGDLSNLKYSQESKDSLRRRLQEEYPHLGSALNRKTQEIFNFVTVIHEGDVVLTANGEHILGIGRVVGDYEYVPGEQAPHRLPVEWLSFEEWELPVPRWLGTTVHWIRRDVQNLVAVEERLLEAPETPLPPPETPVRRPPLRLKGISGRIQAILERKGQVILYGPPGTGKTYWARKAALDLAAHTAFRMQYNELDEEKKGLVTGDETQAGLVRVITFHPMYGYEDFIEGYRPEETDGQLAFTLRRGIFVRLCADAERQPGRKFYLLVDEINRGDIPRIFGELLTLLEWDKRGQPIRLPLSEARFTVPENVYLIGTMNTADRSIALLDTALRRRFGFIELMPDPSVLGDAVLGNAIPLGPWLVALNQRILEHIGRDARNLQIGHAYLLENEEPVTDFGRFARILEEDIVPLLQEYCYEDYTALARILGRGLVDEARQRVRHELFDPSRRDELVQALLTPAPDIATSTEAVTQLEPEATPEDLEDEDELEA